MKRNFFILLMMLTMPFCAMAQHLVSGSFAPLAGETAMKIEIDFSSANIYGMTEEDFALYETDWEKDLPEILGKFLAEANAGLGNKYTMQSSRPAKFCVKVIVKKINIQGTWNCRVEIVETATGEKVALVDNLYGEGGSFGSKLNLIKDGAERTGKRLGVFLRRQLNKVNK